MNLDHYKPSKDYRLVWVVVVLCVAYVLSNVFSGDISAVVQFQKVTKPTFIEVPVDTTISL